MGESFDAVVVGSGPNGLAAAITLAREGLSVLVIEGHETTGGGMRSGELTLPGFIHDVCASVLPLAAASPFFRSLPLERHGLDFVQPATPLAHPLPTGEAAVLERSVVATANGLGDDDSRYSNLVSALRPALDDLIDDLLGPLRFPRRPLAAARFGLPALLPDATLARRYFRGKRARALFAGLAAHSLLPLERPGSSAVALVLALLGHVHGWPFARGGTAKLGEALVSCLHTLGGTIETGRWVRSIDELPPARLLMLDVTPRQLLELAGQRFDARYRRELENYRYGPGVCKVDFALSEPIPWRSAVCRSAGTVHLGGGLEEIAAGERAVWRGELASRPFVIVTQPSLFDDSRSPPGHHTAWAYCHVPHGSSLDASVSIEEQIERFAPGFRETVLDSSVRRATELEARNPNYVGGDINGGVQDLRQLFTRPSLRLSPYTTAAPSVFICSSATPPGGGVHGLCGYHAAMAALGKEKGFFRRS